MTQPGAQSSPFACIKNSKIGRPPVVAPITTVSPSQRLVLRSASLASLRIDFALEFGRSATSDVWVQFLAVLDIRSQLDLRG